MSIAADTWPMEADSQQDAVAIILARKVSSSIDDLLEEGNFEAGKRILEGRHSVGELRNYLAGLSKIFAGDSTLAAWASNVIASNYGAFVAKSMADGSTYRTAVQNLNAMKPGAEQFSPEGMSAVLLDELAGRAAGKYSPAFPGMLSLMWALRSFRQPVYRDSMQDAKWAATIGTAVNHYNAREGIDIGIDINQLFVYTLIHNAGALHPEIAAIASDRPLRAAELVSLVNLGKKGKEVAEIAGFPENPVLSAVMVHRGSPSSYISQKGYDPSTAAFIGAVEAARIFEGTFYKKDYRMKRFSPSEVFEEIEARCFKQGEIPAVRDTLRHGYRYDAGQARKYPLLQPYAMLNLLFGRLERR